MRPIKTILITAVAVLFFSSCETPQAATRRAYNPDFSNTGSMYNWGDNSDGVYDVNTKDDAIFQSFRGNKYKSNEETDKEQTIDVNKADTKRKITYTASVNLRVDNTDSMANYVTRIAETYGGFMSASTGTSITIKVKADSIKPAIEKVKLLGDVIYSSINSQDVTDQYTDLTIRLDNAMKARQRYLELLEKAENVEEALLVEKELERLSLTIDQIKGTLNQLDDRIQYSTITVNYYKKYEDNKPKPGVLGYVFVGLYKGVKWLFVRG